MKDYSKYLKKKSSVIFLFHGVIDKNPFKIRNYTKKHLLKKEFIKVLDDLSKKGNCISLDQVRYNIVNKKNFKDYSYSITFDDGFYNNYKIAAPILKKKELYATFYLTTSFIEKNETSWIDKIEHMIEKVKSQGNNKVIVTERGNSFGYQDLVVDIRNIPIMKSFGEKVVLDITHSLQKPNQGYGVTGGTPEFIETLACAGIASKVDGIFLETHPEPKKALSDGSTMLPLNKLESLIKKLKKIRCAVT